MTKILKKIKDNGWTKWLVLIAIGGLIVSTVLAFSGQSSDIRNNTTNLNTHCEVDATRDSELKEDGTKKCIKAEKSIIALAKDIQHTKETVDKTDEKVTRIEIAQIALDTKQDDHLKTLLDAIKQNKGNN